MCTLRHLTLLFTVPVSTQSYLRLSYVLRVGRASCPKERPSEPPVFLTPDDEVVYPPGLWRVGGIQFSGGDTADPRYATIDLCTPLPHLRGLYAYFRPPPAVRPSSSNLHDHFGSPRIVCVFQTSVFYIRISDLCVLYTSDLRDRDVPYLS